MSHIEIRPVLFHSQQCFPWAWYRDNWCWVRTITKWKELSTWSHLTRSWPKPTLVSLLTVPSIGHTGSTWKTVLIWGPFPSQQNPEILPPIQVDPEETIFKNKSVNHWMKIKYHFGVGREESDPPQGGGIGMGNTCISKADSCQCMTKTTTIL